MGASVILWVQQGDTANPNIYPTITGPERGPCPQSPYQRVTQVQWEDGGNPHVAVSPLLGRRAAQH